MHNVTHEVKDNKLIITVDVGPDACSAAPPSSTGRTMMVAKTGGSLPIISPKGWDVSFSLNVMGKKQ